MIPVRLTLKNFLSYREATLDFNGLHVACICGANGAGKSSLLEAIAWSLWGQSRAVTEDDVIHLNEMEVRVDFVFRCHEQNYRVIRARQRGQSSTLEFQIETPQGFRSLTGKGMRATQQLIIQCIKLDYDTFINSAYLRQGRADEFMLKRPSERKQILADLLKLDQYDLLAEQARERSRQYRAELAVLERSLQNVEQQLQQEMALGTEQQLLQEALAQLQAQQETDEAQVLQLRATQQQRQAWTQQLHLYQQQQQHLTQDCQRLRQERIAAEQQQQQLATMLHEADAIAKGYAEFHSLQTEEEAQTAKFHAHQAAATQRQQLQQQFSEQTAILKDQLGKLQTQQESLHQQVQELQHALRKADDIEAAVRQLHQARETLTDMDQLQMQATPLLQRRQRIQSTLEIAQTRLTTRLEELQTATIQLQTQQQRQPLLRQAVSEIAELVEYLEQRKAYQQKVLEKGQERRNFMEQLQARQRDCERQLAELEQKIALLRREEWMGERVDEWEGEGQVTLLHATSALMQYPPCPLCDRPLDEHHWNVVVERHQSDKQEILNQIWVIREQLAVSEREIQVLRQEYRDLDQEMAHYASALERRGQLQEQLQGSVISQERLQQLMQEQVELERSLQTGSYALELHEELEMLEATLDQLNYDDRDHALARGEVDRWRWAEIKQAEIKQTQRRQTQLLEKLPELEMQIADIEKQLTRLAESPLQIKLDRLDQQIAAIAYDLNQHTALRNALKKAQSWQLRHRELTQAQQQYPQVQKRIQELAQLLKDRNQALQTLTEQIETLVHALEATPDASNAIQLLERQIQEQRTQLDESISRLGRLQQQQQQFEALREQQEQQQQQLQVLRRQSRIYHELAQAFGKNGIQALMIENVLPQLEAETNQILGRLSNYQLHVQFVTQRAGKRKAPHSRTGLKLIDTLDILIADAQGTRPYETYSGGEAFRINFAIRLALARLLAQRSGTALQLLIVDEGFGTQDEAGCDRLIAAIQAIASDFACILTVTHMPRLKEAFQTHIEVAKTEQGSCLSLSI
jgi:exonuclease SbcC